MYEFEHYFSRGLSRRDLLKIGGWVAVAYALSRLYLNPRPEFIDNEVEGHPTIYTPKLAQEVALYNAGLNRELGFYRPTVIAKVLAAHSSDDIRHISGLVANDNMYQSFTSKRPVDHLQLVQGFTQGGDHLPAIAAPQVCHWIGNDNRNLKRSFIWDDVVFTSEWNINPDGTPIHVNPIQIKAVIIDVLAGDCSVKNKQFFSDTLPREISRLYGSNIQVRMQQPYFVTSKGISVNLPPVKMGHLG